MSHFCFLCSAAAQDPYFMSLLVWWNSNECHSLEFALIEKITSFYGCFNSTVVVSSGYLVCEAVHKHCYTFC